MKRYILIFAIAALAPVSTSCSAQMGVPVRASMTRYQSGMASPKNIYYEDATAPPQGGPMAPPEEAQVAVKFWIELHPRDGAPPSLVTAERMFRSGERTRYRVAANQDCFIYVAHEGSLGDRTLLYPSAEAGLDNMLRHHVDKTLPESAGYFTFDNNPGDEHLVIVASPQRIAELDAIVQNAPPGPMGFRTFSPVQNRSFSTFLKKQTGQPSGASTKNIVYEPDVSGGPQTGQYFAQPEPGFARPVIINITLKHQP